MFMKMLLLAFMLFFIGCSTGQHIEPPVKVQHFSGSVFKATQKGLFTAELLPKPPRPVVGKNNAMLVIHNHEGVDVAGADIEIVPWMPALGQGSPEKPIIEDAGRGLYYIRNLYYHKPGGWELKLKIRYRNLEDGVVLLLPEVREN